TRSSLRDSILAAEDINKMKFAGSEKGTWPLPVNLVFAFKSDLSGDNSKELHRLVDVYKELGLYFSGACPELPGPVSGLCVADKGFWMYGGSDTVKVPSYLESVIKDKFDEIIMFVGAISNTCFRMHINRQGRNPSNAVEGGIGRFILDKTCY